MSFARHCRLSLGNIPRIHSFLKTQSFSPQPCCQSPFILSLARSLTRSFIFSVSPSSFPLPMASVNNQRSPVPESQTTAPRALNYAISQSVPQHKLHLATSFGKETHLGANKQTIKIVFDRIQNSKLSRSHDDMSHNKVNKNIWRPYSWLAAVPGCSPVVLLGVNISLIGACSGWAPGCSIPCLVARLRAADGSSSSAQHQSSKSTFNYWGIGYTM